MARLDRLAVVLPVGDVAAALERYRALGFTARSYEGGPDHYGYLERDGVYLHVTRVDGLDPHSNTVSAYLYVDDADALLAEWRAAAVDGRFSGPDDTEYGLREGAYVDPDGNLLRIGSPLPTG